MLLISISYQLLIKKFEGSLESSLFKKSQYFNIKIFNCLVILVS